MLPAAVQRISPSARCRLSRLCLRRRLQQGHLLVWMWRSSLRQRRTPQHGRTTRTFAPRTQRVSSPSPRLSRRRARTRAGIRSRAPRSCVLPSPRRRFFPSPLPCTAAACPPKTPEPQPQTPALRSRWSSSTLSSIHSAHARSPASPETFSFARRYFPRTCLPFLILPKSFPSQKSSSPKAKPRAMGATTPSVVKRAAWKGKGKRGKPLTVADVLIVGRPPAPASVLACASPDVFASASSFSSAFSPATPFSAVPLTPAVSSAASAQPFLLSPCSPAPATPATPYSASAQYAAYPPSPAPSAALYTAYATQRSPRRRASTASNASKWSYSSSAESASDGCGGSECSSGSSGSRLRRKPIPVEMFLR
ncbi:hypothetical protein B0H11DRAFT_1332657 [Mycena galericulata]|nr:hypothetical protein B0H11DRAFT_1332657 [Mycena galericulata]